MAREGKIPHSARREAEYEDEGYDGALKRLKEHTGVLLYVILNKSGIPVKFSVEQTRATQYAGLISELVVQTRDFLQAQSKHGVSGPFHDSSELVTIRLRSKKHEIIISPDESYTLIVVHDPNPQPIEAVAQQAPPPPTDDEKA